MARPGRKVRRKLSRERIEEAAAVLIEREGVEGFSTRKLAAKLGCEAMSIYHYFPSKAHLMDALVDRAVSSMTMPEPDMPWRERVRRVAYEFREMAHRNPKFFQYMVLHRMNTPTALAFLDQVIGIFGAGGRDVEEAARLFRVFGYYISGAALDETSGYAKGPSAAEPVADEVVARDYPAVAAVNPFFRPQHHDATFALGLDMLLKGAGDAEATLRRRCGIAPAGGASRDLQ